LVIRKALQRSKCAAAPVGATGPEIGRAAPCVVALASGLAQARGFRASSMLLDARNFA